MAGVKAYDRDTYLEDIHSLRGRGLTWSQVAAALGISEPTLYRILAEAREGRH